MHGLFNGGVLHLHVFLTKRLDREDGKNFQFLFQFSPSFVSHEVKS